RPGASLVSETLPPLDRLTAIVGSSFPRVRTARSYSYLLERGEGYARFQLLYFLYLRYSSDVDRSGAGPWTVCPVRMSSVAPSVCPRRSSCGVSRGRRGPGDST